MIYDLVIENGLVVHTHENKMKTEQLNVGITGDKIAILSGQKLEGKKTIAAQGLHVLPGIIDSQVHFREPGLTHKEDLESGTRSAALGGVTAIFEMPNTKPPTTTQELFDQKIKLAEEKSWVNFAFYVGAAAENVHNLGHLEALPGCPGVKVFMGSSTGSLLVSEDSVLEEVFRSGRKRLIIHSEDEARLLERKHIALESRQVVDHPRWRDAQSALISTKKLLSVARKTNRPVHVLHVSTADEMELLGKNKDVATVEVLPQHLLFSAPEIYERLGTRGQQNPPIREKHHQDAIWEALQKGVVDVIGSDHAPHTLEEKSKTYPDSPSGMPMVQTLLPIMLNFVNNNRLTLHRLVELLARNPSRLFGVVNKGLIRAGIDADLTLVDLKTKRTVTKEWIASKSGWSPCEGMSFQGWPTHTIVGGNIVMQENQLLKAVGRKVLFSI